MLSIETLLGLIGDEKPKQYRYLLCHPSQEARIWYVMRKAEILAAPPPYAGMEIVSHPNMLLEHCLALSTLEELNKVLGYLDQIERL